MLRPPTKRRAAPTDREGYLLELTDWSPEVAQWIAQREGIALTAEHWRIIRLVRDFYAAHDISPAMRPLASHIAISTADRAKTSARL